MSGTKKTSTSNNYSNQSLRPVSAAARPIVTKLLPKSSASFEQLFDAWPDLMKGTEAETCVPEKLAFPRQQQKEGVLHLWSKTSAQATEISFNKTGIMRTINAFFGFAIVSDIRVTAFPSKNDNKSMTRINKPRKAMACQSLDKSLSGISNPALREVLTDLSGVIESNSSENMDITGESYA